jgi:hypothetical protein
MIMIKSRFTGRELHMRTSLLSSAMIVLAGAIFFSQCSSDKYSISSRNMAEDRDTYDVTATLVYMTEEALLDRFGPNDNPYLSTKTLVSGSDIIAFEVTVQNNTSEGRNIIVPLESIRMVSGNSSYVPQSSYQLYDYWQNFLKKRDDKDRRYLNTTPGKMRYVINETLFANPAIVQGGDTYSGYIAFLGRFSSFGFGEILIPVFDEKEQVIGIFTQEFERY